MSVILKAVFVGAPIACLAGLPPYTGTGASVINKNENKVFISCQD